MISRKNFEIRTVLYKNGLVRNSSNVSQLSQFLSAKDSVHGFVTSLQKGILFISLNYWNFHGCRTIPGKQYLIYLAWFGEKTLKSGLYFYENCSLVKITSPSYRSLSSVQDSVHGFITRLQTRYFLCPWIIEMSNHVGHYWENQFWYSFHDLAKKLWNPDSTLRKPPA